MQDEEVVFSVFNAMKYPDESESCFRIDSVEAIISNHMGHNDPLENILTLGIQESLMMLKLLVIYCGWTLLKQVL